MKTKKSEKLSVRYDSVREFTSDIVQKIESGYVFDAAFFNKHNGTYAANYTKEDEE